MINKVRKKTKVKAKIKAKTKHRRSMTFMSSKQRGFTLIELLVVVSILAALAGITSVAMDGYQQDAEAKITRVEMQRIAGAIRRFKADTGYWPKTGPFSYKTGHTDISSTQPVSSYPMSNYRDDYFNNAANFWWLFDQPPVEIGYWNEATNTDLDRDEDANKLWQWNVDSASGWHGPYINRDAIKTIATDSVESGCSTYTQAQLQITIDKPHSTYPDRIIRRFNGLVDRFQQIRENNSGKDYCVLTRDEKNMDEFKVADYSGSPYLYRIDYPQNSYCSSANKCIALQSFGPNGVDESDEAGLTAAQKEKIDDIVFILKLNES